MTPLLALLAPSPSLVTSTYVALDFFDPAMLAGAGGGGASVGALLFAALGAAEGALLFAALGATEGALLLGSLGAADGALLFAALGAADGALLLGALGGGGGGSGTAVGALDGGLVEGG